MYEVLARRFRRALKAEEPPPTASSRRDGGRPSRESDATWDAPDLFVVDGGRGQLARRPGGGARPRAARPAHRRPRQGAREPRRRDARRPRVPAGPEEPHPAARAAPRRSSSSRACATRRTASRTAPAMRIGKKRRFHSPLDDVKGLGDKAKKALLTARRATSRRSARPTTRRCSPSPASPRATSRRSARPSRAAPSCHRANAGARRPTELTRSLGGSQPVSRDRTLRHGPACAPCGRGTCASRRASPVLLLVGPRPCVVNAGLRFESSCRRSESRRRERS